MPALPHVRIALVAGAVLLATAMSPAHAQSSLAFVSEPGDPIGQGATRTLANVDAGATDDYTMIHAEAISEGDADIYTLTLRAPRGQQLRKGRYNDATARTSDRTEMRPGLSFTHNSASCTTVDGRFEITELKYGPFGYIERMRVNFEQRCNGSKATLYGDLVVRNPRKPPMMKYALTLAGKAVLDQTDADELRPTFTLRCQYRTGGRILATVTQRQGDQVVTDTFEDKVGCGPAATHFTLPMSARTFRPGRATFTVQAAIEDPNYSEYETDAAIPKSVSRTIFLGPPCDSR